MTFSTYEQSQHAGRPIELYRFEFGRTVYNFTSADGAIAHGGATYIPVAISRSSLDQSNEDGAGELSVTLPADNPISRLFAGQIPSSQVYLTVYRLHRGDAQTVVSFDGTVAAATFDEYACELTCQPTAAAVKRTVPSAVFQPQCNRVLFSQTEYFGESFIHDDGSQAVGCGVKKAAFRVDAALTTVAGSTLKSAAFAGKSNGWFTGGYVETDQGEVRRIESHVGDTVVLAYPLVVQVGTSVAAYPGCDGLEGTCRSKFNNVINFSGFERMPARNPFNTALT